MWAVVEIGKKQYLVNKGDIIEVQRLKERTGDITFDKILAVEKSRKISFGTPYVENVQIKALIQGEKKSEKVMIGKFKRRKKYRRRQGHRQIHTVVKVTDIITGAAVESDDTAEK